MRPRGVKAITTNIATTKQKSVLPALQREPLRGKRLNIGRAAPHGQADSRESNGQHADRVLEDHVDDFVPVRLV